MTGELRLGFDAWVGATHAAGIGRYVRETILALARLEHGPQLALFDVGPAGADLPPGALDGWSCPRTRWVRRRLRRGAWRLGEALGLRVEAAIGRVDLFHAAFPEPFPKSRAPRVLPLAELPESNAAHFERFRAAARAARAVIVFSAAAREVCVRRLGLDPARVHCLPVGADHWRRALARPPTPAARPRFLVLGALRQTSRPDAVLRAFDRLRGEGLDADLVFCGRGGDGAAQFQSALRASPHRADVRWIDSPSEEQMPALCASAQVLVHIVDCAWTPVTPLEGCSFGHAIVARRLPAFEEALGDEADYVDDDLSELGSAMARALTQRCDAASIARRESIAARFTWDRSAAALLAVDRAVLGQ